MQAPAFSEDQLGSHMEDAVVGPVDAEPDQKPEHDRFMTQKGFFHNSRTEAWRRLTGTVSFRWMKGATGVLTAAAAQETMIWLGFADAGHEPAGKRDRFVHAGDQAGHRVPEGR